MRLFIFNALRGNRIAFKCLMKKYGMLRSLNIVSKLRYRLLFKNPFFGINKKEKPDKRAKLSQKQMAPLVILYEILNKSGDDKQDTLDFLGNLCGEVALAFLNFTIPAIKQARYRLWDRDQKISFLKKIDNRFFNADASIELRENDEFFLTVNHCYFAQYAIDLGCPELGPLFCASDKKYFEQQQPEVVFSRTRTLAQDNEPCDFSFRWKT